MNDDIRDNWSQRLARSPEAWRRRLATRDLQLGPEAFWNGSEKKTACSWFFWWPVSQVICLPTLRRRLSIRPREAFYLQNP